MRNDELWFYILVVIGCAVFTADSVMDLHLFDKMQLPEMEQVTFEQVKPIFKDRCSSCHQWTNYDLAYENRQKIKFKVWTTKLMPPNGMPQEERELIKSWVDGGGQR